MDIRARKKAKSIKRKMARWLLFINFTAFILWFIAQNIHIYKHAVIGAIYEMIWLPIWGCFFLTPIISFYCWHQEGYKKRSRFMFVVLLSLLTLFLVIMANYF